MKLSVLLVLLVAVPAAHAAPERREVAQIIKQEGRFVFSDGSSYYQFRKDGTFDSGPRGISGRTIGGGWSIDNNGSFVVVGKWGWVNGISWENDWRRLTLHISAPDSSKRVSISWIYDTSNPVKVYHCYFLVEELVKIPKPMPHGTKKNGSK